MKITLEIEINDKDIKKRYVEDKAMEKELVNTLEYYPYKNLEEYIEDHFFVNDDEIFLNEILCDYEDNYKITKYNVLK